MRQNQFALRSNHMKTLSLCLLAIPFVATAQTTPVTCTLATLTGPRSLMLNGRNVSSTAVLSNVALSVGTATFDGAGNVTFSLATNTNQSAGASQSMSGTYTLPSNCIGTLNITTGDTAAYTLIPYNSGKNFTITGQDATYSFAGSGGAPPTACLTATLSGAYAFTGNGYSLASGAIGGVNTISGLLQFDGTGAITGNWSVATSGTTTANTISGRYTVSSSCVASATVTDANGATYTLSFTVTSADGANFQVLLANSTASFTGNGHSTFTNPGLAVQLAAGASLTVPPGSLFSIYGFGLTSGAAKAEVFPLPPTLSNATVTVNSEVVPLYAVDNKALGAEGIINAQMPLDVQPGVATLVVKNGTVFSNSVAINIPATAQPAVFIYGNNHAVAQNFPSFALNSSSAPANIGDTVIVYFTGGGPVQGGSALTSGGQTPGQFQISENDSATIAGVNAQLGYVGLVPTAVGGFYQANVTVPKVGAGDRNLVITINGKASNVTLISVN
jgi:uncharacterized protein (TIGR03437 family)